MTEDTSTAFVHQFIPFARKVRALGYMSLFPLDYVFRSMNRLKHYPPLHLRRHVGGTGEGINGPGYEYAAYLRLIGGLREGDSLWDLACGCGMLELALEDLGWTGRMTGTDVYKPCIDWARSNISKRLASHNYIHANIYNDLYFPEGTLTIREWFERFDESGFDVVIAKSLFTHLLPDELNAYLEGIADRLRPGGKALLTFFILSEEQARLAAAGKSRRSFQPYCEDGRCAVFRRSAPQSAVAYEQHYLKEKFADAGFRTESLKIYPGIWSGSPVGLSVQDIIVAEK